MVRRGRDPGRALPGARGRRAPRGLREHQHGHPVPARPRARAGRPLPALRGLRRPQQSLRRDDLGHAHAGGGRPRHLPRHRPHRAAAGTPRALPRAERAARGGRRPRHPGSARPHPARARQGRRAPRGPRPPSPARPRDPPAHPATGSPAAGPARSAPRRHPRERKAAGGLRRRLGAVGLREREGRGRRLRRRDGPLAGPPARRPARVRAAAAGPRPHPRGARFRGGRHHHVRHARLHPQRRARGLLAALRRGVAGLPRGGPPAGRVRHDLRAARAPAANRRSRRSRSGARRCSVRCPTRRSCRSSRSGTSPRRRRPSTRCSPRGSGPARGVSSTPSSPVALEPRPGATSLAYVLPRDEPELLRVVDTWIGVARGYERFASARRYWILGQATRQKKPRWSVARNVLGWWKD